MLKPGCISSALSETDLESYSSKGSGQIIRLNPEPPDRFGWKEKPYHVIDFIDSVLGINLYGYCTGHKQKKRQEELAIGLFGDDPYDFLKRGKEHKLKVNNIVMAGSGSGKGRVVVSGNLYTICKLIQSGNPQKVLGVSQYEKIEFICGSFSESNSTNGYFSMLRNYVLYCKKLKEWLADRGMNFAEHIGDVGTDRIRFPYNIEARVLPSNTNSSRSCNGFYYVLDEVSSPNWEKAEETHMEMLGNCTTRFHNNGACFVMSQPHPGKTKSSDYICRAYASGLKDPENTYCFTAPTCCMNPIIEYDDIIGKCTNPNLDINVRYSNNIRFLLIWPDTRGAESFVPNPLDVSNAFTKDIEFICRWVPHLREQSTANGKKQYIGAQILNIQRDKSHEYYMAIDTSDFSCSTNLEVFRKEFIEGKESLVCKIQIPFIPDSEGRIAVDYEGYQREGDKELPLSMMVGIVDIIDIICTELNVVYCGFDQFVSNVLIQRLEQKHKHTKFVRTSFSGSMQARMYGVLRYLIQNQMFYCPYFEIFDHSGRMQTNIYEATCGIHIKMNQINGRNVAKIVTPYKGYFDPMAHIAGHLFDIPNDEDGERSSISSDDWRRLSESSVWIKKGA